MEGKIKLDGCTRRVREVSEDGVNDGRRVCAWGSMGVTDTSRGCGHRVRVSRTRVVVMGSGVCNNGCRHASVRGAMVAVKVGHDCDLDIADFVEEPLYREPNGKDA